MLDGKTAVFISCSEKYKERAAYAFRDVIDGLGMRAIIVSDAPKPGPAWTPENKVEAYLDRADVVLTLATPDDQTADGRWLTRQNIIDEIARARAKSQLRERICVLKERSVSLPSNINPVYEAFDIDDLQPAIQRFLTQLRAWGYDVPQSVDTRIAKKPETPDSELIEGLRSDDPRPTNLHVRRILAEIPKREQRAYVDRIVALLRASALWEERAIAGQMLQAAGALDPALISVDLLDELSRHPDFAVRSSTAMILYELAVTSPGTVPIDLVGRLAQPAKEDWYVFTPALNALKQLALARAEAMDRLRWLAESAERDDREYAASALRDVAAVRPKVIPRELVEHVKCDPDRIVRKLGTELAALLDGVELHEGYQGYYRFGPF